MDDDSITVISLICVKSFFTLIFLFNPLAPKWRIQFQFKLSLAYKINLLIPNCSLRIYSNIFKIFSIDRLLLIALVISRREFNLNSFSSNFS